MSVSLRITKKGLDHISDLFSSGLGARPYVRLILVIDDPEVRNRALIWEWGRITCKPGPKTLWSTNPDGETRVMTKTAPYGFIRINRAKYRKIAHEEIQKRLRWKNLKIQDVPKAVEWGLRNAAPKIADIIAATAPIDTGALRAAIRAIVPKVDQVAQVDMIMVRTRTHMEG